MPRPRMAGVLLLILGVLTLGTGTYFLFLRPPLLPEDLRFTGVDPKLLEPRMITWLGIVFRTWGGFVERTVRRTCARGSRAGRICAIRSAFSGRVGTFASGICRATG